MLYPFKDFGNNWNEQNRELLTKAESLADYINSVSHQPYQSPAQLKCIQNFFLEHSGAAYLFMTKSTLAKRSIFKGRTTFFGTRTHDIRLITMDDLQNSVID